MSKSHPHLDNPSEEQLLESFAGRPEHLRDVYLGLHRLVVETVPSAQYSLDLVDGEVGYGAHQFGYDGWGMAAVVPYTKWVSLSLVKATSLDDPAGLLEGTGSTIRHVKVRSTEQLDEVGDRLRALLDQAAGLNVSPDAEQE